MHTSLKSHKLSQKITGTVKPKLLSIKEKTKSNKIPYFQTNI